MLSIINTENIASSLIIFARLFELLVFFLAPFFHGRENLCSSHRHTSSIYRSQISVESADVGWFDGIVNTKL